MCKHVHTHTHVYSLHAPTRYTLPALLHDTCDMICMAGWTVSHHLWCHCSVFNTCWRTRCAVLVAIYIHVCPGSLYMCVLNAVRYKGSALTHCFYLKPNGSKSHLQINTQQICTTLLCKTVQRIFNWPPFNLWSWNLHCEHTGERIALLLICSMNWIFIVFGVQIMMYKSLLFLYNTKYTR